MPEMASRSHPIRDRFPSSLDQMFPLSSGSSLSRFQGQHCLVRPTMPHGRGTAPSRGFSQRGTGTGLERGTGTPTHQSAWDFEPGGMATGPLP